MLSIKKNLSRFFLLLLFCAFTISLSKAQNSNIKPPGIIILKVTPPSNNNDKMLEVDLEVLFEPHDEGGDITFEYFFNNDPGRGRGTVALQDGSTGKFEYKIFVSDRGVGSKCGNNKLFVRGKFRDGQWSNTDSQDVNLPDSKPPVIESIKTPETVELDANGNGGISINDIDFKVTDNCGKVTNDFIPIAISCNSLGTFKTDITFIDGSNNKRTHKFSFEVVDKIKPTALTKNITIELGNDGKASVSPNQINNNSKDNCTAPSDLKKEIIGNTNFTCNNVGSNTVILKVTDASGNSAEKSATITVTEKGGATSPVAIAKNITIQLNTDGKASITADDINASNMNSACGTLKATIDKNSFTCANIGENNVKLTISNSNGKSSSAIAKVTVQDRTPPTALTKNITIELDNSGKATLNPNQIDNNSKDNCTVNSKLKKSIIGKTSFTCSDVGSHKVKLKVIDESGNVSEKEATVTIKANTNSTPVAKAKDITVNLEGNGKVTITANNVNDSNMTTACGKFNATINTTTFTCVNIGKNNVVLTISNGNQKDTDIAIVTVVDMTPPTINTKNITLQLDSNGKATLTPNQIDNNTTDNCTSNSKLTRSIIGKTSFSCTDVGTHKVKLRVVDESGNANEKEAIITIKGNGSASTPVAKAKDITVKLDINGKATITANDVNDSTMTSACGEFNAAIDVSNFTCENIGKNTIVLTISNGTKEDTANAIVTIIDDLKPILDAKNSVDITLDENGSATLTKDVIDINSRDNCTIKNHILSNTSFSCADVGNPVSIDYSIEDTNGNSSSKKVTVNVIDKVKPIAKVKNDVITVKLSENGTATITPESVNEGSYDNCAIKEMTLDKSEFNCDDLGKNISVTLTVTDYNNNTATAIAKVVVTTEGGSSSPEAKAKNITVELNENGEALINAEDVNDSNVSLCAFAASINKNKFTCENIGKNDVTLTLSNGTVSDSDTAIVTVVDKKAPKLIIKNNVSLPVNSEGNIIVTVDDVVESVTDNCSVKNTTLNENTISCSSIVDGKISVLVTAIDTNDNIAEEKVSISVEDKIAPVVKAKNITIALDNSGTKTITPEDVNDNSYDNCSIANLSINKDTFTCEDTGKKQTVILTATDYNGNSDTAEAIITVEGAAEPIAKAKNITIELDENGKASITPFDVDANNATLCASKSNISQSEFTCEHLGDNEVTLTVTGSSSSSSDTAIVTIVDNTKPVAKAKSDLVIHISSEGKAILNASYLDNQSTDNCSVVNFEADTTTFTCDQIGENTVTFTVYDAYGNSDSATTTITVKDNSEITILTKNITVELPANGEATISPSDVDGGSIYGCSISNLTLDKSSFNCDNIGENEVILSAENTTNSAKAIVTVVDTTKPTVLTKNITVQLNENGVAIVDPNQVDNGSFDNCIIANMSLDKNSFYCADIGTHNVNLTATDLSGNSNSFPAVITVESTSGIPDIITKDITVKLDENGEVVILPQQIHDAESVNCSYTAKLSKSEFDCNDIGDNIVTLVLESKTGNSKSATATVTVEDGKKPNASAKSILINLQGKESVSIKPEDIDDGSSDNCYIEHMELSQQTFTKTGEYPVILKVIDSNENFAVSSAIVSVIDKEETNGVIIYPNPVKDVLNVYTGEPLKGAYAYNINGQLLLNMVIEEEAKIDISKFPQGVYFFKFITSEDDEIIKKIIKE